jgi:hypothetical protein
MPSGTVTGEVKVTHLGTYHVEADYSGAYYPATQEEPADRPTVDEYRVSDTDGEQVEYDDLPGFAQDTIADTIGELIDYENGRL